MSKYHQHILKVITKSLVNSHRDNFDHEIRNINLVSRMQLWGNVIFEQLMRLCKLNASLTILPKSNFFINNLDEFQGTYELLSDEKSKNNLIELLAYKALGFLKVKLSLNTPEFHQKRKQLDQCMSEHTFTLPSFRRNLFLFDLNEIGYDLELYFVRNGIYVDYVLQQYNYNDLICVNENDVVIDAGACWGDTALYFSARGASKVYAYEFIPSNIGVFEKNISLNPQYQSVITLVNAAVWQQSGIELSFDDRGPASRVGPIGHYTGSVLTLSIDDLVKQNSLESVDFLKMDIEGAELDALVGAAETIKRFKPKLAISVYHKPEDMIVIPEYIHELNPNYDFYLDYYTIIGDEIMLYAIDQA